MSNRASSSPGAQVGGRPSPAGPGRHGLCPACGRAFRLEGGEVPPEGLVVDCPGCGAPMPLSSPPRRRRSYRIVSRPVPGADAPDTGTPPGPSPPPATSAGKQRAPARQPARARPSRPLRQSPAPRRTGWLLPVAGLLLGLGGGAGLLALLAGRAGSLSQESLLALPIWAKAVAAALPLLGLACGLLLRRRR